MSDDPRYSNDEVLQFLARVRDEAFSSIEAATVPIYFFQNDKIGQNRTGVLFKIADTHFILTAAHQLQAILENNIPLCADFSRTHNVPIPLVEAKFHFTEEDKGRDVAAIELPQSVVDDFLPVRRFLTMADVDIKTNSTSGIYAAFGFPNAWFQTGEVTRSNPLSFLGAIYEDERNPSAFYDARVHLVVGFHRRSWSVFAQTEKLLPKLEGMSGCGMWRIIDYSKGNMDNWTPKKVRLVALQHRSLMFNQNRYIQGTWMHYVLGLIWDQYPTLRDAMRICYPRGY